MTYSEAGVFVRTVGTVVGMSVWLLGISPPLQAQQAAGPITVTACAPCHGTGTAAAQATPNSPKLDGQHAAYLDKQLREYKSGKRKSAIMAPIITALKKQQIPDMAKHFASQSPARGTVQNAQLATAGKALYEQGNRATGVPGCVGCHLSDGAGSERYPRLAGQPQAYIVQQLTDFKSGTRSNDRAHVMRAVAGRLTDEEIRAVAEYLAGLQ
jgi:cbb3-type cytochrome c oxidase subunit III